MTDDGSRRSGRARAPVSYADGEDTAMLDADDADAAAGARAADLSARPSAEKRRIADELAQAQSPKGPASSEITDPDAMGKQSADDVEGDAENSNPPNGTRQPSVKDTAKSSPPRRASGSQVGLAALFTTLIFNFQNTLNCDSPVVRERFSPRSLI
jgi:hypothetical protein